MNKTQKEDKSSDIILKQADKSLQALFYYANPESDTHGDKKNSLLKAGYAESTANKQAKQVLERATSNYSDLLDKIGENSKEKDTLGFSKKELQARLRDLVEQDTNKRVAADLTKSLLKLHGINLDDEEGSGSVPTLDITIKDETEVTDVEYEVNDDPDTED